MSRLAQTASASYPGITAQTYTTKEQLMARYAARDSHGPIKFVSPRDEGASRDARGFSNDPFDARPRHRAEDVANDFSPVAPITSSRADRLSALRTVAGVR